MKRVALALLCSIVLAGCTGDRLAGERYRAERDLWQADWELRNLSLRSREVSEHRWVDLAARYEAIATRYERIADEAGDGERKRELQTILARALFSAAQVHVVLRDSARIGTLYEKIARDFDHIDAIAAEVAFAQAAVAQGRGELLEAAAHYEKVLELTFPKPGEVGVAGHVLDLPLLIARLRAQAAGGAMPAHYDDARTYYEGLAADHPGELLQVESQTHLAEIAADLGDWEGAVTRLEVLEDQLDQMESPPRQPCDVRYAIAGIQARSGSGLATTRTTLLSLLEDYPDCGIKAQVLLTLADNANKRNQVEEALAYLDRIRKEHRNDEDTAAQALMVRGRMLEHRGRWQEALEAFRELSVQYPLAKISLSAPLEIAQHYARAGDREAELTALSQAEERYRDFLRRYPPGRQSLVARERLVQCLVIQEKHEEAISEMESLGSDLIGRPEGITFMLAAARMAQVDLADTLRSAEILERTGALYSETEIGQWARAEADRLRGASSQ